MEVKTYDGAKVLEAWKNRVCQVNGKKLQGSGVLIDKKRILTAAHLGFTLNQNFKAVISSQEFSANCIFISTKFDFAILSGEDLPDKPIIRGSLDRGYQYFIMGYPHTAENSIPAIINGIIESLHSDNIHFIGTPGARGGYSGGPVVTKFDELSGILIGGIYGISIDSTIKDVMTRFCEQKCVRILSIYIIEAVLTSAGSDNES